MTTSEVNCKFKKTTLDVGGAVQRVGCKRKRREQGGTREKAPRKKEEKYFSFFFVQFVLFKQSGPRFPLDLHVCPSVWQRVVLRGVRSHSHLTRSDATSRPRRDAAVKREKRSWDSRQTAVAFCSLQTNGLHFCFYCKHVKRKHHTITAVRLVFKTHWIIYTDDHTMITRYIKCAWQCLNSM